MPELPEIEVIKQELKYFFLNQTITKTKIYTKKLKYKITKEIKNLNNQKIKNIKRYSKYIIITTNKGFLLIHLGMSGNIFILNKNLTLSKHDHIELHFNNKKIIRYNDTRKFGFWLWYKNKKKINNILSKLGPEPLTKEFNYKYLFKITQKRKICIHQLIMNKNIISGIGNIYANESLFLSKIIPYRKSNSLTKKEIKILTKKIKFILNKSIKLKGTIKRNKKLLNKNKGLFKKKLKIYRKNKKKCPKCYKKIKVVKNYGRSLYFCDSCQK